MKLLEISKEEFAKFESNHHLGTFFQSLEMENVYNLRNRKSIYLGLKDGKKLVGATLLLQQNARFNKKMFYCPRGPLLDYDNEQEVNEFFKLLKEYCKKNNGYMLRINPPIINIERDCDFNPVPNGLDNSNVAKLLVKNGFIDVKQEGKIDLSREPKWGMMLDIKNKTCDEIFKNFKQNHRNLIHKAEKYAVKIKEISFEELPIYKSITEETANRRGFADKSMSYYETVYKNFVNEGKAKFIVAYIDTKEYYETLNRELKDNQQIADKYKDQKHGEGKYKEALNNVNLLTKRIEKAKELRKEGKIIYLSAALFMLHKNRISYLSSGSLDKYMFLNAQYLIQWWIIKYAIENNFEIYDFYGISGNLTKDDPEFGIYEFKKGFNSVVYEYIGDFDNPLSIYYYVSNILHKIKK